MGGRAGMGMSGGVLWKRVWDDDGAVWWMSQVKKTQGTEARTTD